MPHTSSSRPDDHAGTETHTAPRRVRQQLQAMITEARDSFIETVTMLGSALAYHPASMAPSQAPPDVASADTPPRRGAQRHDVVHQESFCDPAIERVVDMAVATLSGPSSESASSDAETVCTDLAARRADIAGIDAILGAAAEQIARSPWAPQHFLAHLAEGQWPPRTGPPATAAALAALALHPATTTGTLVALAATGGTVGFYAATALLADAGDAEQVTLAAAAPSVTRKHMAMSPIIAAGALEMLLHDSDPDVAAAAERRNVAPTSLVPLVEFPRNYPLWTHRDSLREVHHPTELASPPTTAQLST